MKTFEEYGIYLRPDKQGEQYISCPQCSNQRKKKKVKCLSVNTDKQVWICHHCGWRGSLEKGANFADDFWIKPQYREPSLLKKVDLPDKVINWFIERGIYAETLAKNKITIDKVYMPQAEEFVAAIGFPYFRGEDHVNTKWRSKDKDFRQEAGAEKILYGLNDISDSDSVIWVEGEMDKLSLFQAGIYNVVSIPDGAPPPDSTNYSAKFSYLETCEDSITGKSHILFVDNDSAGQKLEQELARRLGRENCTHVVLPDDLKDANEALVKYGTVGLREIVAEAIPYPVSGLHKASDLASGVDRLHTDGLTRGVSTGWKPVDWYYTVKRGQMTILTGIPNHGKSNWLDCMLLNIATEHDWSFGVFSPENQPLERHAASLLEKRYKTPFKKIVKEDVTDGLRWLDSHFHWILPEEHESWSLKAILEKAKTLILRHGIDGLVIDPWNEVEHRRPAQYSETEYISEALTTIRNFARLHDIHIWVVAHPAKIRKDQDGNYPVPTPYDISGSAHWRNKADNCIAIYRYFTKDKPNITDVYIHKIRFKEIGNVGMTELRYSPDDSNYSEVLASDN